MAVKMSMNGGHLSSVADYNLSSKKKSYKDLMTFWRPSAAPAA